MHCQWKKQLSPLQSALEHARTIYIETTLDFQDKRILKKVVLDEEDTEVDEVFTTLMGDKVEPRRIFIEENAKYVKNLDI